MIPLLAQWVEEAGGPALFRYLTTRTVFAFLFAFLLGLVIGRPIINRLYQGGMRSRERTYGDINTQSKAGTPVMGGLIILASGITSALLFCDLRDPRVLALLVAALWFGAVGLYDDFQKVKLGNPDAGLGRVAKYGSQFLFGGGLAFYVLRMGEQLYGPDPAATTALHLPFFKEAVVSSTFALVLVAVFFTVFSTNAVNFTDGMDGLVTVPVLFVLMVLGIFAYLQGHAQLSEYLFLPHMPGAGETTVFAGALVGGALAFLWFNAYPAEVFMGDAGSLMLGGVLGTMAVLLKQEAIFVISGGLFVAEISSTAFQEWFGLPRGRRLMHRAPLHHTLQHRGMSESKVVVRVWIVCALLAALSLATLKIR